MGSCIQCSIKVGFLSTKLLSIAYVVLMWMTLFLRDHGRLQPVGGFKRRSALDPHRNHPRHPHHLFSLYPFITDLNFHALQALWVLSFLTAVHSDLSNVVLFGACIEGVVLRDKLVHLFLCLHSTSEKIWTLQYFTCIATSAGLAIQLKAIWWLGLWLGLLRGSLWSAPSSPRAAQASNPWPVHLDFCRPSPKTTSSPSSGLEPLAFSLIRGTVKVVKKPSCWLYSCCVLHSLNDTV